jgi:hypothetical protein
VRLCNLEADLVKIAEVFFQLFGNRNMALYDLVSAHTHVPHDSSRFEKRLAWAVKNHTQNIRAQIDESFR